MNKLLRYIFILMTVVSITSCKKFLDVNKNPNSPTTPPINGLLTRATSSTALNVYRVSTNITSQYVQYLASPNSSSPNDIYEPIDASTTWNFLYENMTDIYDLGKLAESQGATQYQGVAKILMALNLHLVHNVWGDAPYSDAFTGNVLTPTYDNAQTIYQTCLTLIDEGIPLIQKAGSTRLIPTGATGNPDLIHKGQPDAWVRTAQALKARLLNQVSKTAQYNSAAVLTAVGAAYTSAAQDASITTFDVRNPWNQEARDNAGLLLKAWLSKYYVESMNGTIYGITDPRLALNGSLTRFNDYRGTRNGAGRPSTSSGTNKDESYVNLTGYYSNTGSPLYIITYEEMKFIEAEAAFRSNNKTRAYAAYLEGTRANMIKMGVTTTDREAYVTNPAVSVGEANLTLRHIFTEKYKALFLMPVTWDDARRFDYQYQGFQLPVNVVTTTFVRRLVYPSVETSRNGKQVPAVADVTQKLWWDQ